MNKTLHNEMANDEQGEGLPEIGINEEELQKLKANNSLSSEEIGLIQQGKRISVDSSLGRSFYNYIIEKNTKAVEIIAPFIDINEIYTNREWCKYPGRNALHIAVEIENLSLMKLLIEKFHAKVDEKTEETSTSHNETKITNKRTALHIACEKNNMELVKYLINEGHANVDEKTGAPKRSDDDDEEEELNDNVLINQKTALHIACENENMELIKYLITEGHAKVDEVGTIYEQDTTNIRAALHIACEKRNMELIKYLITEGHANVNKKAEKYEYTEKIDYALMTAVETTNFDTALRIACDKNNTELTRYLSTEYHTKVNEKPRKPRESRKPGKMTVREEILREAEGDDSYSYITTIHNKRTALHIACINNDMELIKYLITECHANVNEKTKESEMIKRSGKIESYFYTINRNKTYKRTALRIACEKNNMELFKYLITEGHANINENSEEIERYYSNPLSPLTITIKRTELHIACEKNDMKLIKYLITEGHANVNEKTKETEKTVKNYFVTGKFGDRNSVTKYITKIKKRTALRIACEKNNMKLFKYLITEGNANIDEKTYTKILEQEQKGEWYPVKFKTTETTNGKTELHIACEEENMELIKYLITECHANVNEKTEETEEILKRDISISLSEKTETTTKRTALHIACQKSNMDLIDYLIYEGDANIYEKAEETIESEKTKEGNKKESDYKISVKQTSNKTPVEVASSKLVALSLLLLYKQME